MILNLEPKKVLAKSQGIDWRKIKKPLDLQKALKATLLELIDLVKLNLHPEVYTMSEVCDLLETTQEELTLNSLTQNTSSRKKFANFYFEKIKFDK